mmetsp:Transcript_46667/g.141393  ORF Transcript_46667/g.141393 Transcript_46667/m.141393 type:complete len:128 (+) Transcript_46667:359-742(+)
MRYQLTKVPIHGMKGTIGVRKYRTPSSQWAPTALRPPKTTEAGHRSEIAHPTQAVSTVRDTAIVFPNKDAKPCTRKMHDKQASPLKERRSFSSNMGRSIGESRRITTSEQLVTEKATRIPADTKSSR